MIQALVLADRCGAELDPICAEIPPALLPLAGKPLVQHCLEDLWEAGIREAVVAIPAGDGSIRSALGDGARFGLSLTYILTPGEQWPSDVMSNTGLMPDRPTLVARGDIARGRCARALIDRAQGTSTYVLHGMSSGRFAGMSLLSHRGAAINRLDWSQLTEGHAADAGTKVDVGAVGVAFLEGLGELHDALLSAVEGRFQGLVPDGRPAGARALRLAPRARLDRSVQTGGSIRVGRLAEVHADAELRGRVDIGERCVIDTGAHIVDSVVLPGTYVGRGVRLRNAIAAGAWLYRADLDTRQWVDDPLLLAGRGLPTAAATEALRPGALARAGAPA